MGLIDFLQANWAAVMAAPWVFVSLAFIFGGGGWAIGRFMYGERIELLKSRIEAKEEKIAALETAVRLEKEKTAPIASPPLPTLPTLLPVKEAAGAVEKADARASTPTVKLTVSEVEKRLDAPIKAIGKKLESPQDILVRRRWTFHFSPKGNNGQKAMTFLPDGTIGEGRNDNEYRWVFEGGLLVIYRRNGDVQNSFWYDADSGQFDYLPDQRAQGFKDQYLQPR
jgi:hypothetical protein